jgi:hypothetical protein
MIRFVLNAVVSTTKGKIWAEDVGAGVLVEEL